MSQLALWLILVVLLAFLMVLRPAWSAFAVLVVGLLLADRLGVPLGLAAGGWAVIMLAGLAAGRFRRWRAA